MSAAGLSTHVLDLVLGAPAAGVAVELAIFDGEPPTVLARGVTNADGRLDAPLLADGALEAETYELRFDVGAYFAARGQEGFLDVVPLRFVVRDRSQHHHVPLLVSPWAYSTYRGS